MPDNTDVVHHWYTQQYTQTIGPPPGFESHRESIQWPLVPLHLDPVVVEVRVGDTVRKVEIDLAQRLSVKETPGGVLFQVFRPTAKAREVDPSTEAEVVATPYTPPVEVVEGLQSEVVEEWVVKDLRKEELERRRANNRRRQRLNMKKSD